MAEAKAVTTRYAVVSGANKGIGLEICRQLASQGDIIVILTARDEKKGIQAVEKLKESDHLSDKMIFHQLDVGDSASVASLFEFINTHFGKLDILVNNAAINGVIINEETLKASTKEDGKIDYMKLMNNTNYEVAKDCLNINYYGAKRMVEALIPLLQKSHSPRIVNVSSSSGKLQNIPSEWAKRVLTDAENLTEEGIEEVINLYLEDYREGGSPGSQGWQWPVVSPAYSISKACMNGYTKTAAKKYPSFKINSVSPGYVKTDMNLNTGSLSVVEGAECIVRLALLPNDGPSGLFFDRNQECDP